MNRLLQNATKNRRYRVSKLVSRWFPLQRYDYYLCWNGM